MDQLRGYPFSFVRIQCRYLEIWKLNYSKGCPVNSSQRAIQFFSYYSISIVLIICPLLSGECCKSYWGCETGRSQAWSLVRPNFSKHDTIAPPTLQLKRIRPWKSKVLSLSGFWRTPKRVQWYQYSPSSMMGLGSEASFRSIKFSNYKKYV